MYCLTRIILFARSRGWLGGGVVEVIFFYKFKASRAQGLYTNTPPPSDSHIFKKINIEYVNYLLKEHERKFFLYNSHTIPMHQTIGTYSLVFSVSYISYFLMNPFGGVLSDIFYVFMLSLLAFH